MARTREEIELHISTQTLRIIDLEDELFKRRLILRDLFEEKKKSEPIAYAVVFRKTKDGPAVFLRSVVPLFHYEYQRCVGITKSGRHRIQHTPGGVFQVWCRSILGDMHLGDVSIGGPEVVCSERAVRVRLRATLEEALAELEKFVR